MKVSFTVLGKPQPQGSSKGFVKSRRDGSQYAAVTSDNPKMRPWRQEIGWTALRARADAGIPAPWAAVVPVRVVVLFVFAKPKSAKKKRAWPTVKPDWDKLLRAVGDALTGVIYMDDAQVIGGSVEKQYGLPERAEITVETVD